MIPLHDRKYWHVTSSCGHACCLDCLQQCAACLIRDPEYDGPLKCPVCPQHLQPSDASKAIGDNQELIAAWNTKKRDQLLRVLPGYRHCPHCSNRGNYAQKKHKKHLSQEIRGGGFVTPGCLASVITKREGTALSWLGNPVLSLRLFLILYALYALKFYYDNSLGSLHIDLIISIIFPAWVLTKLRSLGMKLAVFEARRALFRPIGVGCPCCGQSFLLNVNSEFGNTAVVDYATQKWIEENTRPCPSCSVPISKIDGCNHMQCSNCRTKFCWACMRISKCCKAYGCKRGAFYGNATLHQTNPSRSRIGENFSTYRYQRDDNILSKIIRMENESSSLFVMEDLALLTFVYALTFVRDNQVVQFLSRVLWNVFAGVLVCSPLLYPAVICLRRFSAWVRGGLDPEVAWDALLNWFISNLELASLEEADAIHRSIAEQ